MRVLIVPSWYPTDENPVSGIFFREQAEALRRHGVDVRVVAPELARQLFWKRAGCRPRIVISNVNDVPTYRYIGGRFLPPNPWENFLLFAWRLRKLTKVAVELDNWKPDLVHLHSAFWGLPAAVAAARRYGVPLIVTEHSTVYFQRTRTPIERMMLSFPLVQPLLDYCFRRVAHVIAVSPSLLEAMKVHVRIGAHSVIPNMVPDYREPASLASSDRKGPFLFFCLGGLIFQKGIDVLIAAARVMKDNGASPFRVRIGGAGPLRGELQARAKALDLDDTVEFVGQLDRNEVLGNMRSMDCFVLPSRIESFGVVYAEALLQGKPVIATRAGGPEFIVTPRNGVLVDVDDARQLADAMTEMMHNCSRYDPSAIRADALARFGEQAVIARLLDRYRDVVRSDH